MKIETLMERISKAEERKVQSMEKYYLIKSESTATPQNENFAGEVHTYIHGKGDETLYAETGSAFCDKNLLTPYFVREYGYKRLCDAKRNWCYKHPQNDKHWRTTVEIETWEIRADGKVVYIP